MSERTVLNPIQENLTRIRAEIAENTRLWGRDSKDIHLIAVSKTKPAEDIEYAIKAGQRDFGENRVQEALEKFVPLKRAYPDVRLHLIGPLQSNKVADAVAISDVIHSLDREKLALLLAAEMKKQGKQPKLFIQVNIGEEPQKAGITPIETPNFVVFCRKLDLPIVGLMCIPPHQEEPAPYFALLAKLAKENNLLELSMGMSEDFPKAIALGATYVRVGSAIFGART